MALSGFLFGNVNEQLVLEKGSVLDKVSGVVVCPYLYSELTRAFWIVAHVG